MKRKLASLLVWLAAIGGCAWIDGQVAADSEEILAQAGFHRQPLDEPGLPARHLVQSGGLYRFADPDFCQCVYVGGAKEHAELQRLRAERRFERAWIQVRSSSVTGPLDRMMWGPWDPEGLDVIRAPIAGH